MSAPRSRSASTSEMNEFCSVRPATALELKETPRGGRDRAGGLAPVDGPKDRDMRRGTPDSTGGASRTRHRGTATRSIRPPERDRFLESIGSLRDLVLHYARTSTWMLTLASAFACTSFQLPLRTDNLLTRGLLFFAAVGFGALVGKRLDRAKRRRGIRRAKRRQT